MNYPRNRHCTSAHYSDGCMYKAHPHQAVGRARGKAGGSRVKRDRTGSMAWAGGLLASGGSPSSPPRPSGSSIRGIL